MNLKETVKMLVMPMILSTVALLAFFIGGLRLGARLQREIDYPMYEECINQLINVQAESVAPQDAGTP